MIAPIGIDPTTYARICQGDVFRNVMYVQDILQQGELLSIKRIRFPLIVVLTQDCDLKQDQELRMANLEYPNHDKQLLSALVAPAYNAEDFERGEHLSKLDMKMQLIPKGKKGKPSTAKQQILNNENPRYHFLRFPSEVQVIDSVIDFKHYFSVNVEYLQRIRKANFECKSAELFREQVSQRFANYLARIGLPEAAEKAVR